jgi:hypothetical protein
MRFSFRFPVVERETLGYRIRYVMTNATLSAYKEQEVSVTTMKHCNTNRHPFTCEGSPIIIQDQKEKTGKRLVSTLSAI